MLGGCLVLVPSDRLDPSTFVFATTNVEKLARDLRLQRKGEGHGRNKLSAACDKGFESVERDILWAVEALCGKGVNNFISATEIYFEQINLAAEARAAVEINIQVAICKSLASCARMFSSKPLTILEVLEVCETCMAWNRSDEAVFVD